MDGNDEIIFTGEYKDFKLGIKFDLRGKNQQEAASALAFVSSKIEPEAFRFSGVNADKINALAKISGKGLGAVYGFLESIPPSAIKSGLADGVPKQELLPAAESMFFNSLLRKAGVGFMVAPDQSLKPLNEEIGSFIGFSGKYNNWVAIKKLGLSNIQDYEVGGILSGVNHTVVNKAFDFAGVKKDDVLVGSVVKGKRRVYSNVASALRELEPKLNGSGDDAYAICKTLEGIGYKPYASPEMLTKAYPDIKPPKVKGRKPKG